MANYVTVQDLIDDLLSRDFDYYMDSMLDNVPDDLDKRQGSIIYDALAPAAQQQAEDNLILSEYIKQSYTISAEGEFLDLKGFEKGKSRDVATNAVVTAKFLDTDGKAINNVAVGDRFASLGDEPIFYTVIKINSDLTGLISAEIAGTNPNGYIGQILPVTPNDSLSWAEITEISIPARDDETDDVYRDRILASDDYTAYGGNIADYQDMLKNIKSVGKGQVYSAWQGGGTVKLVILDNSNNAASKELLNEVKETIDPVNQTSSGYGLAPIGDNVTVVAPSVVDVDIDMSITTDDININPNDLRYNIQNAINSYIKKQVSTKWDVIDKDTYSGYHLTLYRSQILAEVLKVEHVINASIPKINGADSDLILKYDNDTSELPVLRDVNLSNE
ncbi:baseplate J-like protein [Apilactobacillus ozensis DSM 23829 = JCM 17196]|uniref:Baseplate J-like protein n=1 Tax=Apilactobacillus ozensis DSM 23829 = JCM 17196 TaxID=1423781 RepID=A0A0R2AQY7_9LACO|nr:baseplate J/gp47 family protein [Apilactobacillus ozensis]KRM69216.1 baseplate J-like protein [Apilactobacillus ozensis DSM 23829 = JCM 17196]